MLFSEKIYKEMDSRCFSLEKSEYAVTVVYLKETPNIM